MAFLTVLSLIKRIVVKAAVLSLVVVATYQCVQGAVFTPVALSGVQAPGVSTGQVFSSFFAPVLSGDGAVYVQAELSGPAVTSGNRIAIWHTAGGDLGLLARGGELAADGKHYGAIDTFGFRVSAAGHAAFTTESNSLWFGRAGAIQRIARAGDIAPGPSGPIGTIQGQFNDLTVNVLGEAAYRTGVGASTATNSYYLLTGDGLQLIAQGQGLSPGNGTYGQLTNLRMGNDGQVTFQASLQGTPAEALGLFRVETVMVGRPGAVAPLVTERDPLDIGGTVGYLDNIEDGIGVNGVGDVVFSGTVTSTPGAAGNLGSALWVANADGIELVAREQMPVWNLPGYMLNGRMSDPFINDDGLVVFNGFVSNGLDVDSALLAGRDGVWRALARDGDTVPGTAGAYVFTSVSPTVGLNAAGQIVFVTSIKRPGDSSSIQWPFVADESGHVRPVLLPGEQIDVDLGAGIDLRTVSGAYIRLGQSGSDGYSDGLNDRGDLAVHLTFEDGSTGIFITTIPEPASMVVLAISLVCLSRRPRN